MLYAMVFAPFLAALLMLASSGKDARSSSRLAIILSSLLFVMGLSLLVSGDYATMPLEWFTIPGLDITVTMAFSVNGFSAWMVFLANIITLAALISSRKTLAGNYRNFAVGLFAQLGALNGTFLAVDAVLFFFFFEALVLPAAILIGSYGGPDRKSASLNFALYTLIGSAPMAVALWYVICQSGSSYYPAVAAAISALPESTQTILFWCFAVAFWVKTPLFPLHGWQAVTYAEAPAGLSAILTGSMSKAGVYGLFFWVLSLFPVAVPNAKYLLWIGLFTAIYGALMAMRSKDIKKLLAFSSMSHLGLAVAAVFSLSSGIYPAILVLLVGHGLSASALFILSGSAERFAGNRLLDKMGGYSRKHPVFAFFFAVACVLAIAVPGSAGFVGEFLVLTGIWNVNVVAAVVVAIVIILSAVYMLLLIQKVLFGEGVQDSEDQAKLRFPISDAVAVTPLLLLLLVFGFHPAPIIRTMDYPEEDSVTEEEIQAAIAAAAPAELSAEDSLKLREIETLEAELLTDSTAAPDSTALTAQDSAAAIGENLSDNQVEAQNVR